MIFRILRTTPPLIRCMRCLTVTRWWDDRQAARWKRAHTVNCPRQTEETR